MHDNPHDQLVACGSAATCPIAEVIAERAARSAIHQTFFLMGIDLDDPQDVTNFRDGMRETIESSKLRKERVELVKRGVMNAIITTIVSSMVAGAALLWHEFKQK